MSEMEWSDVASDLERAERLHGEALLQCGIDEVLQSHGGQPVDAVLPALQVAIAAHGLERPPHDWLTAVAVEISRGDPYVVGPQSVEDAAALRRAEHGGDGAG